MPGKKEALCVTAARELGVYGPPDRWYHASPHWLEEDGFQEGHVKRGADEEAGKHWNSHLGIHVTSDHLTARELAEEMHGNVHHVSLSMKNPVHYPSEHQLTNEAHAWTAAHPDYGRDLPREDADYGGHLRNEDELRHHPRIAEVGQAFRDHLRSQGHDGITYGNEHEGPIGHLSAIAFSPHEAEIDGAHSWDDDDDEDLDRRPTQYAAGRSDHRTAAADPDYYHATYADLKRGDALKPMSQFDVGDDSHKSQWGHEFYENSPEKWRAGRVWLFKHPAHARDYIGGDPEAKIYRVRADDVQEHHADPSDEESMDYKMPPQYHARSAVVEGQEPKPSYHRFPQGWTGVRKTAQDPDSGLIHRGVTVVLPHHIHSFVHDESQPAPARAHMLLSETRKQHPEITSEEAHGTTGGLGNFWSPSKEGAASYAEQSGSRAYHDHEREHGCGDEEYGEGGCPTTKVVIHAGTPPEEHHWSEVFRNGERYDPELSWRLPVRPGAPLMVHGVSWKEGEDNKPYEERKEGKIPFERYDFLRPVKKQAVLDPVTKPHQAATAMAQKILREQHPEVGNPLPYSEQKASQRLQGILEAHGHPGASDAFVMRHEEPGRGTSQVVHDADTGAVGVALHDRRYDYGTLAHEAGHILDIHRQGMDVGQHHEDDVVHGDGFRQGYHDALHHLFGPDVASTFTRNYRKHLRLMKDDPSRYKVSKITFGPGADEHIGEDEYDPDETWDHKGLWDRWHPQLQPTIHRHLAVEFPSGHPAHDKSAPVEDRARAVVDHVSQKDGYGRQGKVGWHWTDDPNYKHLSTGNRVQPGQTKVTLHAQTPPREHIEDADWLLQDRRGVRDWDTDPEREVPVKRNAPVKIMGVSWHSHDGPQHHTFAEPITRRAMATDWDKHYPEVTAVHRGMGVSLPKALHAYVHDESQPRAARAQALLEHVQKRPFGKHWSADPDIGKSFATQYARKDPDEPDTQATPVVIHAQTPARESIQTDPKILKKHRIKDFDKDYYGNHEMEVPLKRGAPLHISAISWANPDSYQESSGQHRFARHYFDELVQHKASYVPPGTMGTDSQGHGVQITTMDGWAHRDGSHGHEDGPDVGEQPVYTQDHTWLPEGRYWGPNSAQNDQRLFSGDHLRPEVRQDILDRVGGVLGKYGDWQKWTRVYFAGSQAAQWLDQNGQGNGDFDILIGIDFDGFWDDNHRLEELTEAEVASMLTDDLWEHANVRDYFFTLADGRSVGPFDRTFFVNPRAWDIKKIHPYAAYNVTDDDWAVHPLQVPKDWDASHLPESYWAYAEALLNEVKAIGTLPAEERHRMAANLWEELHTHRSDAFGDEGHGLFDLSNVVEKYMDQHPDKPWEKLVQWKNESASGPHPWVPTTARRTTLTALFDSRTAAAGADYGGMMIAIVPPKRICKDLAIEDGEPVDAMHVTLAYLGGSDEYDAKQRSGLRALVEGWARTQKPLEAHVGGVGTFVTPKHVLWAAVDIPDGGLFRESLVETLERHGYNVRNDHGWTPHLTLSYDKSHFRFMPKVKPVSWDVTEIMVCVGGAWEAVPIG